MFFTFVAKLLYTCISSVISHLYIHFYLIIMANETLIERVKKIIEQKDLNPSYFADHIGISRSSMNHVLNGRNNPSLDVITKILEKYPDINSDWLLFGKEPMFCSEKPIIQTSLFDKNVPEPKIESEPVKIEYRKEVEIKQPVEVPKPPIVEEVVIEKKESKKITKVMILYSDNTFESLSPDKKSVE